MTVGDTKISAATDTTPPLSTDMLPLARSGDTTARKITVGNFLNNAPASTFANTQTFTAGLTVAPGTNAGGALLQSQGAATGVFTESHVFNSTRDDRIWMVYNLKPSGTGLVTDVASEPTLALLLEGNYNNGVHNVTELNFDYHSANVGTLRRWLHQETDRATDLGLWQFWGGDASGVGDLVVGADKNIQIGNVTGDGISRLQIAGDSNTAHYALRVDGTSQPAIYARNDGRVSIGNSTFTGGATFLDVAGGINLTGGNIQQSVQSALMMLLKGRSSAQAYSYMWNDFDTGNAGTRNLQFYFYLNAGAGATHGNIALFAQDDGGPAKLVLQSNNGALQLATATGSVGFYGTAPIARAVLATGTGKTVDNVITALQNLGLVSQT